MRQAPLSGSEADVLRLRCDARALRADAIVVDRLARLALVVGRQGGELELWRPSPELRDLIGFMGLEAVLLSRHR